jgi:hypothetical protein
MSFLTAPPSSPWPLERSFGSLADAARHASAPGIVWGAGLAYQFLAFSWAFGASVTVALAGSALPQGTDAFLRGASYLPSGYSLAGLTGQFGPLVFLLALPLAFVVARLAAGLARISPSDRWAYLSDTRRTGRRTPTLRQAWRAGKGHTRSTIALWIATILMIVTASALFLVPAQLVVLFTKEGTFTILSGLLAGMAVVLALMYGFLLAIVFQLALHSLVHNKRGVASALLHSWRLARNDPGATARAVVADLLLVMTALAVHLVIYAVFFVSGRAVLGGWTWVLWPVFASVFLAVESFIGIARSGFWARAYFGLGGVSTRADAFQGHVQDDGSSVAATA